MAPDLIMVTNVSTPSTGPVHECLDFQRSPALLQLPDDLLKLVLVKACGPPAPAGGQCSRYVGGVLWASKTAHESCARLIGCSTITCGEIDSCLGEASASWVSESAAAMHRQLERFPKQATLQTLKVMRCPHEAPLLAFLTEGSAAARLASLEELELDASLKVRL